MSDLGREAAPRRRLKLLQLPLSLTLTKELCPTCCRLSSHRDIHTNVACPWFVSGSPACSHGDGALPVTDRRRALTNLRILGNLRPGPMRRNSLVTFLQTGGGENVCPPAEAMATVVTSIHFGPDMPDAASWD